MDGEGDMDIVYLISKAGSWCHCPFHPGPYSVLFGPFLCPLCQGQDKGEASLLARVRKVREHSLSSWFKWQLCPGMTLQAVASLNCEPWAQCQPLLSPGPTHPRWVPGVYTSVSICFLCLVTRKTVWWTHSCQSVGSILNYSLSGMHVYSQRIAGKPVFDPKKGPFQPWWSLSLLLTTRALLVCII